MRVIHISKVTGVAGSERHLLMLLSGLRGRGVEASMLVLEDPAQVPHAFYEALEDRRIPFTSYPIRGNLDPGLLARLVRRFRADAPDMVHTHLIHGDLYGLSAAWLAGIPVSVSSRHNDNPFRRNAIIKLANRLLMRTATRVIASSSALANFITTVERIPASKVQVIRYGLESRDISPNAAAEARLRLDVASEVPVVGFFGRLIAQKGVAVLLEAFSRLQTTHPSAQLVIVGDGDLRAELERQATSLAIGTKVTFTGWVEDASALMPGCDIVVMPSRWEGFGLVALEAMNAHRPLIASRVSALPEIVVDGETGRLVHPDDPAELATAIGQLLDDPAGRRTLGEAGYARRNKIFGSARMVDEMLALYNEVLPPGQLESSPA